MAKHYRHKPDAEGWSIWVHPLPGYRMTCCDCGLVHEMEFRRVGSRIIFRARRHIRSTAAVRAWRKRNSQ